MHKMVLLISGFAADSPSAFADPGTSDNLARLVDACSLLQKPCFSRYVKCFKSPKTAVAGKQCSGTSVLHMVLVS